LRTIHVLARNGATGLYDSLVHRFPHGSQQLHAVRRSVVDSAGGFHEPHQMLRTGELPSHAYRRYAADAREDTLRVPAYGNISGTRRAYYVTSSTGGRLVRGLSHVPFEHVPAWAMTWRQTVIGGEGDAYVLYETDRAGDTIAVTRGPRARRPVPGAAAPDSLAALRARIDSLPVPLEDVFLVSEYAKARELPDSLPSYVAVYAATDGRLWVEQWPESDGSRVFDVFSSAGEFVRAVRIAADIAREPVPYFTGDAIIGDPGLSHARSIIAVTGSGRAGAASAPAGTTLQCAPGRGSAWM
jgi:hypothetical protein